MVTLVRAYTINEYMGTSTDTKPLDAPNGSIFVEIDTGDIYFFNADSGSWVEQFSFQG